MYSYVQKLYRHKEMKLFLTTTEYIVYATVELYSYIR